MAEIRNILFITGTRADFGKIKPLITATKESGFGARIFATGMHMLAKYGLTHFEIGKSGFDYFPFYNSAYGMDGALAATITGLSNYVRENRPDLLVVHGDRVEALAGACVGALNNILVAHVEGGEVSGTIDESIRHAVSKLAHLHFVSNEDACKRLEQMGEAPDSIHVIGSPDIDVMLGELPNLGEVREKYSIPFDHYAICIMHPVTTENNPLYVFQAIQESERNFVIIYPNNDTGGDGFIPAIEAMDGGRVCVIPSMRFEYFLSALKHADFIIGNSSAGIREAPVYGVPTINVGTRQSGRAGGPSIQNIQNNLEDIRRALQDVPQKFQPSYNFGCGNSGALFAKAIQSKELWDTPVQKRFFDLEKGC